MPPKPAIPADIEAILGALQAASREAEGLWAAMPAEVLEGPPGAGQWSPAQCLEHLAMTNYLYIGAMRTAIKPALHLRNHERSGPVKPGFPTRWFLSHLEPPVKQKVRAPRRVTPAPVVDARAALKEFQQSQAAVVELLMECRHLDLNRIRFANPFFQALRFTVGAGFLIIAAHERRHLWQAARVQREVIA